MVNHFQAAPSQTEQAAGEMDELIADTITGLAQQMRFAPPEVKPLYAVAIKNLKDIDKTKPSQQNLIVALKAIHEITGMKLEQRLMLDFAREMFAVDAPQAGAALAARAELEEETGIVDAELVD